MTYRQDCARTGRTGAWSSATATASWTIAGLDALQEYFDLGVNFGQASVNRHRIELFILDHDGAIAGRFTRLQWNPHEVLQHACALVTLGDPDARRAHQ